MMLSMGFFFSLDMCCIVNTKSYCLTFFSCELFATLIVNDIFGRPKGNWFERIGKRIKILICEHEIKRKFVGLGGISILNHS